VVVENINEKNLYKATMSVTICDSIGLQVYNEIDPFGYFSSHQAPAVDVVGVGLQSGKIVLHNLKFDEVVMSFHQDWGPVTALSFRTGIAASAITNTGVIACFSRKSN